VSEDSSIERTIAALTERLPDDQVFGPVVEQSGTTLLPVAEIRAGGGLGGNRSPQGAGGGVVARPVGAWSIGADGVRWHPAVSVNRIVLGGQVAAAAALITAFLAFRRKR